ncbi:MAG: histidine phosphatase family protein [Alphaproteobacteria bacterium]|nr:histidine phosphatase family protein [Alphaproteobacteria bacterium]
MRDLPDLYLMRHGETAWNAEGRLQGALDAPLTPQGVRQALWQAQLVISVEGTRLCSPQGRARRTAELIWGEGRFRLDERLAEIGIGSFAGCLLSDLRRDEPDLFSGPPLAWYDRCPGGEGLEALARRCRQMLKALSGPTLVVSHGITLRMLRLVALGQPMSHLAEDELRQGAVHLVAAGRCRTLRHPEDRD